MKKKNIIISLIVIIIVATIGILISNNTIFNRENNYLKFNSDEILLEYTVAPAYGKYDEMYDRTTKIYNDGKAEILNDNKVIDTFYINKLDIVSLQSTIARVTFMELDEDVSTKSADGTYRSITVNTKTETHTSKGLNPSNKRFCELQKVVEDIITRNDQAEKENSIQAINLVENSNGKLNDPKEFYEYHGTETIDNIEYHKVGLMRAEYTSNGVFQHTIEVRSFIIDLKNNKVLEKK